MTLGVVGQHAGEADTPSLLWAGMDDTMRNAESAGINDLESLWLVRLAMKESWLSPPSCTATLTPSCIACNNCDVRHL